MFSVDLGDGLLVQTRSVTTNTIGDEILLRKDVLRRVDSTLQGPQNAIVFSIA